MNDKRRLPRKRVAEILEIFDPVTDDKLGRLVNITVEGFLLYSQNPIQSGDIFQLEMPLPRSINDLDKVSFGAEVVWSSMVKETESHWSGFRIIDISPEHREVIDTLIADWDICDE